MCRYGRELGAQWRRRNGRYSWEVEMMPVKQNLGFAAVMLVIGVVVGGCAVTSEEHAGSGVAGPVVVGQCAEDTPGCDDTAVSSEPAATTGDNTPTTLATSTTAATLSTGATDSEMVGVALTVGGGECDEVHMFERPVETSRDQIAAAFGSLVGGPTDEDVAAGADSFFSTDTSGMVRSVTLDEGELVVSFGDLRSVIPNASTTCGSMALLAQLNTTAFQFDVVDRVRYEIEGSCDLFADWLQRDCMEYTRDGAHPAES